jgi:hypothetical protein
MDSLKDGEDKAHSGLLWFLWGLQSIHGAAAAGVPNLYMVEGVDSLKVWPDFSSTCMFSFGCLRVRRFAILQMLLLFSGHKLLSWKGVTQSGFCNRLQITWIVP